MTATMMANLNQFMKIILHTYHFCKHIRIVSPKWVHTLLGKNRKLHFGCGSQKGQFIFECNYVKLR